MKKLLISVLVVSCVAGMATAAPMFKITPSSSVQVLPGESVWLNIIGTSPTRPEGFQGLELYSVLEGNFAITSVLIDQPGSGTGFEGNSTGAYIDFTDPKAAIGMVTTASGFVPAGATVAKIQIKATGVNGDFGSFTTDGSQFWGAASNFADGQTAVQDTVTLSIIPEPMTALLLLAAVPFLRRRSA